MRLAIVGLGNQGRKRLAVAGAEVMATVDPVAPDAAYRAVEDVPLASYDAALVCTGDQVKLGIVAYLLEHGKHVLVEKPLLTNERAQLENLAQLAERAGVACYTAYNHRFEPLIAGLKEEMERGAIGQVYHARLFYGNGTARDVRNSAWRDEGLGVLTDLGSHLLDLSLFLLGTMRPDFTAWQLDRYENNAYDHAAFGTAARPALQMETSLLSWRNTFTIDIWGESGSMHLDGLCKWGPSTLNVRKRLLPSGRPTEIVRNAAGPDPTWEREYRHFKELCGQGIGNIANDIWINDTLNALAVEVTA